MIILLDIVTFYYWIKSSDKSSQCNTIRKKILIDLDGVLNEYGKEKYDENYIPEIKEGTEKIK